MTVIIAVSGWRGFTDASPDRYWIAGQLYDWETILTQGRNTDAYWRVGDEPDGFDFLATREFRHTELPHCIYVADWDQHGKAAGPIRSQKMLAGKNSGDAYQNCQANFLLAFPQPGKRVPKHEEVSGTWRAIELAKQAGITFIVPGHVKTGPEGLF